MTYLFGGSFDPVTLAHEKIIAYLLEKVLTSDDLLYLLPNGDDYHFRGKVLTSYKIRKEMLDAVITDKRVVILDLLNERSFAGVYQILEELNHPVYVIGSDLLSTITEWLEPVKLIAENRFLVINREGFKVETYFKENPLLKKYRLNFNITTLTVANYSSSSVRNNNDFNQVSKNIYEIIVKNNLYRKIQVEEGDK